MHPHAVQIDGRGSADAATRDYRTGTRPCGCQQTARRDPLREIGPMASLALLTAVDTGAMTDLDDIYRDIGIIHRIHNAVVALPYSVPVTTGQLLAARRARITGQTLDASHHALALTPLRYALNLADGRSLETDSISCHCA
jgi:hypothetical protein